MKINLFTNWYKSYRDEENEVCLMSNLRNSKINRIYLFCDDGKEIPEHEKIIAVNLSKRATYECFFHAVNEVHQDISIIANSDIYFDDSLDYLELLKENECFALTRWDVTANDCVFYNRWDSQDAWIFKGKIKENVFADFEIGRLGCDNRISYELKKAGYIVRNPSLSIKAYHLHLEERTENSNHDESKRIPPPYSYLLPSTARPFLSIITRHLYTRPNMFKKCQESVLMQNDHDFEHIVIEDKIGIGSAKANGLFYKNKERVIGKYVFMLDDDNVFLTDDFVENIKTIVRENNNPGLIFVRMLLNEELYPTSVDWKVDKLHPNHIDTANVVVRSDLWHKYIHCFAEIQTGDFLFIDNVFKSNPTVYWQDKVYSRTMRVSGGKPEENMVDEMVTGIVVTHNTKTLIERAYNSIRKFHPNMKIIVVDGSDKKDACYSYVNSLSSEKTKVIHAKGNIGHGRGLCAGIEHVKTPYFLIFDSDTEMKKSPLDEMMNMMEDNTWGVGYIEKTDLGGFEWGSRKGAMNEGPIDYMHPYFCLIQTKEYKKYPSFIHHGAPAVNIMLYLYRMRLSKVVLKEFFGLQHTGGSGWTWQGKLSEWIAHDTKGTRDVRVKKGLKEIEGTWDKVVDPGVQTNSVVQSEDVTVITCTGDRTVAFNLCVKWMQNQTLRPKQWIVVDDGKIPMDVSILPSFTKYIRREPLESGNSMIQNMREGLKHVEGKKIIIWEDDEYYAPRYIEVMSKKLDEYELVGIGRSKYYYLPGSTYHIHSNMGHASLAQTAFKTTFLPEVLGVLSGNVFLDARIWNIVNKGFVNLQETGLKERVSKDKRALIFNDSADYLYVGMKGLPGRPGTGSGHKGIGTYDSERKKLKELIPVLEDYNTYCSIFSPTSVIEQESQKSVTVITCTGDRPESFDLLKKWMNNQVKKPAQWIVVDDGEIPIVPSKEFEYYRRVPSENDYKHTLCLNMIEALQHVKNDKIIIMEDDDWYSPIYIDYMSNLLDQADLVGLGNLIFYYPRIHSYMEKKTVKQPAFAQTAFHKNIIPVIRKICDLAPKEYELCGKGLIDAFLWKDPLKITCKENEVILTTTLKTANGRMIPKGTIFPEPVPESIKRRALKKHGAEFICKKTESTGKKCIVNCDKFITIGMKGMPGRKGLTTHHDENNNKYKADPDYTLLKTIIKTDVQNYSELFS